MPAVPSSTPPPSPEAGLRCVLALAFARERSACRTSGTASPTSMSGVRPTGSTGGTSASAPARPRSIGGRPRSENKAYHRGMHTRELRQSSSVSRSDLLARRRLWSHEKREQCAGARACAPPSARCSTAPSTSKRGRHPSPRRLRNRRIPRRRSSRPAAPLPFLQHGARRDGAAVRPGRHRAGR